MVTEAVESLAAQLAEVALTTSEYEVLAARLGRAPNRLELGIVGALWSEHCSYKTSRSLLRTLPTSGDGVLQGPGENAGAVDIGDGLACVFKIESHNHPSAIEPYQGAATGVGGILRDIFTMGARPIALLDSLRFGLIGEPHQRHLLDGVVAGVGGYGNCIGVPTVGGELYFDEPYSGNCLVNVMCAGVVEHGKLMRAAASGPGNAVLLVGADTGRDGIHGASFASVRLDSASAERRPAVQVGNPFLEKCLMEACLELAGDPRVVAMQDLGAAGLCGSASELAHRGGMGVEIDVTRVARRERGMTPYEVMLSESQERMLLVVAPDDVASIQQVFDRWDLHSDVIGTVISSPLLMIRDGAELVAKLPLDVAVDGAPERCPEPRRPALEAELAVDPAATFPPIAAADLLLHLLKSPNIGSRRPVFRRYDHQVGDGTVVAPGGDAAVVRVPGTSIGLALTTDGNGRYAALDPARGAAIAVCEAARNVVATGARPVAATNCLNFGDPEKPEVYWQLVEAVRGLGETCAALGLPIVSGNVSLYNESDGSAIDPTVVVGVVGRLADVERRCTIAFKEEDDLIALVGPMGSELGGSELQRIVAGVNAGARPDLDIEVERRVQRCVREAIERGLLRSAHDLAEGGLLVALAESCLAGGVGARVGIEQVQRRSLIDGEAAGILFGESQSRFLVSLAREALVQLHELSAQWDVPFHGLGAVGGASIVVTGVLDVPLREARAAYEGALIDA